MGSAKDPSEIFLHLHTFKSIRLLSVIGNELAMPASSQKCISVTTASVLLTQITQRHRLLKSPSQPGCVTSSGGKLELRANQPEWFLTRIQITTAHFYHTHKESSKQLGVTLTPTKPPRRIRETRATATLAEKLSSCQHFFFWQLASSIYRRCAVNPRANKHAWEGGGDVVKRNFWAAPCRL